MRTIIIYVSGSTRKITVRRIALLLICLSCSIAAHAADVDAKLVIRDHKFDPAELSVPAGTKIRLTIENQDATPEEFESTELNREKVVVGKGTITVFLGPLDPGKYHFFGDFHQETAQGDLVAK